jgi:hypothetical protein
MTVVAAAAIPHDGGQAAQPAVRVALAPKRSSSRAWHLRRLRRLSFAPRSCSPAHSPSSASSPIRPPPEPRRRADTHRQRGHAARIVTKRRKRAARLTITPLPAATSGVPVRGPADTQASEHNRRSRRPWRRDLRSPVMASSLDKLPKIGAPATRALNNAGYTALGQLAGVRRSELAELHGMGPKAFALLRPNSSSTAYGSGRAPHPRARAARAVDPSRPRAVFHPAAARAMPRSAPRVEWLERDGAAAERR